MPAYTFRLNDKEGGGGGGRHVSAVLNAWDESEKENDRMNSKNEHDVYHGPDM